MVIAELFTEPLLFLAVLSENWDFSHTMSIVSFAIMTYDHRQQNIVCCPPII